MPRPPRLSDDHVSSRLRALRGWTLHDGKLHRVYEFPDSLNLPHNVMEAAHRGGNSLAVFPTLNAVTNGGTPPGWAAQRLSIAR